MSVIDLELDLARNLLGKLKPETRKRLQAVVNKPTQKTWDAAHCVILSTIGRGLTLWQAVLEVEPTFTRSKPYDEPWPTIPSRETLIKAIQFATH